MSKKLFYLLSFTWGILMTLAGLLVASVLLAAGYKPQKFGYCTYFEVGDGWGGFELGPIFITSRNVSEHVKKHEHGHGFQNCMLGPLMPFIVSIPSAIRYWYREYLIRVKKVPYDKLPPYDSIWFEGQATEFGNTMIIE